MTVANTPCKNIFSKGEVFEKNWNFNYCFILVAYHPLFVYISGVMISYKYHNYNFSLCAFHVYRNILILVTIIFTENPTD